MQKTPDTFAPSPGQIKVWHPAGGPGVRIDSQVYSGYKVPPFYDSMIGKIIVHGIDRKTAIQKMRTALSEMVIEGIKTNLPLQRRLLDDIGFQNGGTDIHYLEKRLKQHLKNKA